MKIRGEVIKVFKRDGGRWASVKVKGFWGLLGILKIVDMKNDDWRMRIGDEASFTLYSFAVTPYELWEVNEKA
jgi:hypothetical protein